ncbi:MAG: hypothetical protein AAB229_00525 [Candidatus Hydrogenedentota bacterium]
MSLNSLRTSSGSAFSLVELLVVSMIVGLVLLALGRFFQNYLTGYQETQARLRLQRDMRALTYWIRKDLTALVKRQNNFELSRDSGHFSFLAADDPMNSTDMSDNSSDNGLDSVTYTCSANKITRKWDPLGGGAITQSEITLESIEPARGDTYAIEITLYDIHDSPLARSNFDGTFGNYECDSSIKTVDLEIIFSKKPVGPFSQRRPRIMERGQVKAVAMYKRAG